MTRANNSLPPSLLGPGRPPAACGTSHLALRCVLYFTVQYAHPHDRIPQPSQCRKPCVPCPPYRRTDYSSGRCQLQPSYSREGNRIVPCPSVCPSLCIRGSSSGGREGSGERGGQNNVPLHSGSRGCGQSGAGGVGRARGEGEGTRRSSEGRARACPRRGSARLVSSRLGATVGTGCAVSWIARRK